MPERRVVGRRDPLPALVGGLVPVSGLGRGAAEAVAEEVAEVAAAPGRFPISPFGGQSHGGAERVRAALGLADVDLQAGHAG